MDAHEIKEVRRFRDGAKLMLDDGNSVSVSKAWLEEHRPQIGGAYQDGVGYFTPKEFVVALAEEASRGRGAWRSRRRHHIN